MKYLEKIWVRGLISFFGGAVIPEWVSIYKGELNKPVEKGDVMPLFYVIFIYCVLTYIVKQRKKKTL